MDLCEVLCILELQCHIFACTLLCLPAQATAAPASAAGTFRIFPFVKGMQAISWVRQESDFVFDSAAGTRTKKRSKATTWGWHPRGMVVAIISLDHFARPF